MKCLCVAGFGSYPRQFHSLLLQAGMAPALPAPSQPPLDIHTWHRQVVELLESLPEEDRANPSNLGRMWERLAGEIFLANADVPVWGWADERSTELLEFWRDFDPRLNFLLLFISAESLIAAQLGQPATGALEIEKLLKQWQKETRMLLGFARANPKRCLMLDAEDVLQIPAAAIKRIASKWRLRLELPSDSENGNPSFPNAVARLLARHILQSTPEAYDLQQEVAEHIPQWKHSHSPSIVSCSPQELFEGYAQLIDRSEEQTRIGLLETQLDKLVRRQKRTLIRYRERHKAFLKQKHEKAVLEAAFKEAKQQLDKQERKLQALEARLSDSVDENEILLLRMHQAQEEVELLIAERDSLITANSQIQEKYEEERKRGGETLVLIEERLRESTEENELLLQQLHATHEELETVFLKGEIRYRQALDEQKELSDRLHSVTSQLSSKADEVDSLRGELENLWKDKEAQQKILLNVKQELAVVQSQRDQYLLNSEKQQAQLDLMINEQNQINDQLMQHKIKLDQAANQIFSLKKQLDEVSTNLNEARAARDRLAQSDKILKAKVENYQEELKLVSEAKAEQDKVLTESKERLRELEKDNRRLLTRVGELEAEAGKRGQQLSDLQEKLEQSSMETDAMLVRLHEAHQDLETSVKLLHGWQARFNALERLFGRLQELYPTCLVCDSVQVKGVSDSEASWVLHNFVIGGRHFPELKFSTVIEHGMAGFVFCQSEATSVCFFNNWPVTEIGSKQIILLPLATPSKVEERSNALLALSSDEWKRLLSLTDLLISVLADETTLEVCGEFRGAHWLAALQSLKSDLVQFPQVPRFSKIKLKRQQVNPDYEHIWLAFEDFCIGNQRLPVFEFRLSCANVDRDVFGAFPKLEFPRQAGVEAFESWFAESSDDFGDKMELRYALPEAMDLNVWHALSQKDRAFLNAVIQQLPRWLRRLELQGGALRRSWDDWLRVAKNIQRITKIRTARNVEVISANPVDQQKSVSSSSRSPSDGKEIMRSQTILPSVSSQRAITDEQVLETLPTDVIGNSSSPKGKRSTSRQLSNAKGRGLGKGSSVEKRKKI